MQNKESGNSKTSHLKLSSQKNKKKKERKRVKKAKGTHGTLSSGPIYTLWESRRRKEGTESLIKEIMIENVPNLHKEMDIKIQKPLIYYSGL